MHLNSSYFSLYEREREKKLEREICAEVFIAHAEARAVLFICTVVSFSARRLRFVR